MVASASGRDPGPALLQLDLLPACVRPAARTLSVIGHCEFRQLLRQIEQEPPAEPAAPPTRTPPTPQAAALRGSTGWSRPLYADHATLRLVAAEAAALQAVRARRRPGQ